jgi:hypothetical protein
MDRWLEAIEHTLSFTGLQVTVQMLDATLNSARAKFGNQATRSSN